MAKLRGAEAYPIYFFAKPSGLRRAGELRHVMTSAEKKLWEYLRERKVLGARFRRQHPVGEFIVDFFCYEAMLAIEVDGSVHENSTQAERDVERTRILNDRGIQVLRFLNEEVLSNPEGVIEEIKKVIVNGKQT
jgi:very-short-patch-repair endonuclease